VFVDVVFFVRGGQHFRLIDVIDPNALQYLQKNEPRR
jgi:hypothetical protein